MSTKIYGASDDLIEFEGDVRIDQCVDEDADMYSDVAHFKDGLKWAYAAMGD